MLLLTRMLYQVEYPDAPWTLDANNIPTNLGTDAKLKYYPGISIPESASMNLADFQAAYSEWTAKSNQNDKIDDCLVQLRKTLPVFFRKHF